MGLLFDRFLFQISLFNRKGSKVLGTYVLSVSDKDTIIIIKIGFV